MLLTVLLVQTGLPARAAGVDGVDGALNTAECGDALLDPAEFCDDGPTNGHAGGCCTRECTFQPSGLACQPDLRLCTTDACDAAGSCTHIFDHHNAPHCTETTTTTTSSTTTSTVHVTTTTLSSHSCGNPAPDTDSTPKNHTASASLCSALGCAAHVSAADALYVLYAAVQLKTCLLCVCDVDDNGAVNAADALLVLQRVVGLGVRLTCPAC